MILADQVKFSNNCEKKYIIDENFLYL